MRTLAKYPNYAINEKGEVYKILFGGRVGNKMKMNEMNSFTLQDEHGDRKLPQLRTLMIDAGYLNPRIIEPDDKYLTFPKNYNDGTLYQIVNGLNYYISGIQHGICKVYRIHGKNLLVKKVRSKLSTSYTLTIDGVVQPFTNVKLLEMAKTLHGYYNDRVRYRYEKKGLMVNSDYYLTMYGEVYEFDNPETLIQTADKSGNVRLPIDGKMETINIKAYFMKNIGANCE